MGRSHLPTINVSMMPRGLEHEMFHFSITYADRQDVIGVLPCYQTQQFAWYIFLSYQDKCQLTCVAVFFFEILPVC